MLRILDTNKTPILGLTRYFDCSVTSTLSFSDKTLKFTALIDDVDGYAINEGYILTKDDRFVIKEVNPSFDGRKVEIVAQLDVETLEGKAWPEFIAEDQTISALLSLAFVGTGWTVGTCEIDKVRSMAMTNCSSLDILTEALKVFRCECTIDSINQTVNIFEEIGEDRGVYFTNELNLKKLDVKQTSYDFYTEIEPYGKAYASDGSDSSGDSDDSSPRMTSLTIGEYDFFEFTTNVIRGDGTNRYEYELLPNVIKTFNTRDRISVKSASETDEIRISRVASTSGDSSWDAIIENNDEIRWYYNGDDTYNIIRIEIIHYVDPLNDPENTITAYYHVLAYSLPETPCLSSLTIGVNTLKPSPGYKTANNSTFWVDYGKSRSAYYANPAQRFRTYNKISNKFYSCIYEYDVYTYNDRNRLEFSVSPSEGVTVKTTLNGQTTSGSDYYLDWIQGENQLVITLSKSGYYDRVYQITAHKVSFLEFREQEEIQEQGAQSGSQSRPITIADVTADDIVHDLVSDRHYITNYSYSSKSKRYIWNASNYSDPEVLAEDARAKLEDMSKPYVAYSADVVDLANASSAYSVLAYSLGDTITLLDATTNTKTKQRITEIVEYENDPERNTCTLANTILTFEELQRKWSTTADQMNNLTGGTGYIDGSNVRGINAGSINGLATEINNLFVSGKLTAVEAEIGTLYANVGYFEELHADEFTAHEATINHIVTMYLEGDTAKLNVLEADTANIIHLLANDITADSIETITLTSHNTTVTNDFVETLLARTAIVDNLISGTIYTDNMTIGSSDGRITLSGATQQFKDANGTVRLQIGEDATGNFTFVLYDAAGSGILLDSTGIHNSSMIDDGLIVDDHVASDAGIMAEKLNIESLFRVINDDESAYTLKANRIWFDDEGQSLNQLYTSMSESVTSAEENTSLARTAAQNASDAAQRALDALAGISTLNAVSIALSNEAHVVHTENDGTGGDYSGCFTIVDVYLGDTNISDQATITATPSNGLTGTWNSTTRKYQVTDMATDNGYVDFVASYSSADEQTTQLAKRFSISKAKDGQIGINFNLNASVLTMSVDESTGVLTPATVTFSTTINDGYLVTPYNGYYVIEESSNGTDWTAMYSSASAEASVVYTPRNWKTYHQRYIRATLKDEHGNTLDTQTVSMLVNAEGLTNSIADLNAAQQAFVTETYKTDVADFKDSINEVKRSLLSTTTELNGVSNGTYVWQPSYEYTGWVDGEVGENDEPISEGGYTTITLTARLYYKALDVTREFPASRYSWTLKTENSEEFLGYGYTYTFDRSKCGFGASIIAQFSTEQNTAPETGEDGTTIDAEVATVGPSTVDQSYVGPSTVDGTVVG